MSTNLTPQTLYELRNRPYVATQAQVRALISEVETARALTDEHRRQLADLAQRLTETETRLADALADQQRLREMLETAVARQPRARSTDPETSHEAAASVKYRMSRNREAVLEVLAQIGPATDERIAARYQSLADMGHVPKQSESGLRTRRAELVAMGKVRQNGTTTQVAGSHRRIVWAAV